MKSFVVCPVCKQEIKKAHGYEHPGILSIHIALSHPEVYEEIAEVNDAIERIEQKYKIYSRDFYHYRNYRYTEEQ